MAKYRVTAPAYIRGEHLAPLASTARPETIEVADDVAPSRKWIPLDTAAQAALKKLKVDAEIPAEAKAPEPKKVPETNAEMNAQRGGNVVGRPSDRKPL